MNKKTFNQSVDLYADRLYRFALKHSGDEALASDLVQEAFEVLWRNRKKVDRNKVRNYLFSTAHHLIVDNVRREQRKADFEQVDFEEYYFYQEYTGAMDYIEHLLNQLPPVKRSVLVLRDFEGYSYQEIAEITELNESQVKVYIHRARKFLRYYIGKMDNLL